MCIPVVAKSDFGEVFTISVLSPAGHACPSLHFFVDQEHIYLVERSMGTISVLSSDSFEVIKTRRLGIDVTCAASDARHLYLGHRSDGRITVMDINTLDIITVLQVGEDIGTIGNLHAQGNRLIAVSYPIRGSGSVLTEWETSNSSFKGGEPKLSTTTKIRPLHMIV